MKVPSLDLYRPDNPFRVPWPWEFRDHDRPAGVRHHVRGGLPRAVHVQPAGPARCSQARRADFDLVHDNQCLGTGLLGMMDDGWPVLRHAAPPDHRRPRPRPRARDERRGSASTLRRWYGFLDMQMKVARADPAARHRVRELAQARHRRADGRRPPTGCTSCPSASTRTLPPAARRRARPRPPHDHRERRRADEGARPAARGAREGAHRARRRRTSS